MDDWRIFTTLAVVLLLPCEMGCPSSFNTVGAEGGLQTDGMVGADGTVRSEGGSQNAADGTSPGDGKAMGDAMATSDAEGGAACTGLSCDGGCLPNDIHNCGVCGRDCTSLPHVMGAVLACDAAACIYSCASGFADCADAGQGCPDDLTLNGNCGACGTTCSGSAPVCSGSKCASTCGGATPNLCGSTCRNTQTDPSNCGACGISCSTGMTCDAGQCACIPCVLDQTNIDQCCLQ